MEAVHVAITREVQPGKEAEFEQAILRFIRSTMDYPGVCGALLLKPPPEAARREYGILRSFADENARDAFYASTQFADWVKESESFVVGDFEMRQLHGLEAFFRGPSFKSPPRWKMAAVTWLGVYPCVVVWSQLLGQRLGMLPSFVTTGIVTLLVVVTLTWVVMPALTKMFKPWLHKD